MVPRLPSEREASVGEVNRARCWFASVPIPGVSRSRDLVVLGADVVGGGSADGTCDKKIKRHRKQTLAA